MIGILLLLSPVHFPGQWLFICWLLPLFMIKPKPVPVGVVKLTVLDVGQGLSVLIQTRSHTLLYDTGMGFPDGYNMGSVVILPYLRHEHISHLDQLMISHGDADHAGGASTILSFFPSTPVLTSVPERFPHHQASHCMAGQSWVWDNVNFDVLYPLHEAKKSNDNSCVIHITAGSQSALLTGDIEKSSEQTLVLNDPQDLAATILIAPHHGSKTSSSQIFLDKVRPQYVVFSTGYFNRYHFPSPLVESRYANLNAKIYNTAYNGAVVFTFGERQAMHIEAYREAHGHFWQFTPVK